MGEVVELGERSSGGVFRQLEPTIRHLLMSAGLGQHGTDWVIDDLKQRDLQFVQVSLSEWDSFPEEARVHLAAVSKALKDQYLSIVFDWFAKMVWIEADLYRARFRERPELIAGGKRDE